MRANISRYLTGSGRRLCRMLGEIEERVGDEREGGRETREIESERER